MPDQVKDKKMAQGIVFGLQTAIKEIQRLACSEFMNYRDAEAAALRNAAQGIKQSQLEQAESDLRSC